MRIIKCNSCNKLHLEFNNLLLNFKNKNELKDFLEYLDSIDIDTFKRKNIKSVFSKDIFIPVPLSNIKMAFNDKELETLKDIIRQYINRKKPIRDPLIFLDEQMN